MAKQRVTRLLLSSSSAVALASLASASTWYVRADAAPGGTGTSWASAFNSVQTALAAAGAGDAVWVKAGTYRPGAAGSARTVTFQMKNGVALYGGFVGNETTLAQRDWRANATVLSGDLALDDGPNFSNRAENAYHVVIAYGTGVAASSVLDGFVVRGGNANGTDAGNGWGGGVFGADATLRNLTLTDNEAYAGGGVCVPEWAWTPAPISNCTFRANRVVSGGGGLLMMAPNFALHECVVAGNAAKHGGGIQILLETQAPGSIRNCVVAGNTATNGTAGLQSSWCQLTVVNTSIAFNHSSTSTGGMSGGGQPFAAVTLANSIAWGNSSSGGLNAYQSQLGSAVIVADTAVQGGSAPLDVDPRWYDANGPDDTIGTADDDFSLSCTSPCIDRGNNAHAAGIVLDLAGNARFADDPATPDLGTGTAPIVDLGPYEFVCACDQYANYCATNPNTSGLPAAISASGSTSVFANSLVLHASDGPPLKNGIFFFGANALSAPWGEGVRCVASPVFRLPLLTLDSNGDASFALDLTQAPAAGVVFEGSTWRFQFYFRDPQGGPAGWNTSNGISVTFCR